MPSWPRSRARKPGGFTPAPSMRVRARPPQPRESGPAPPPQHRPRSGGRRRLADARPGRSRGTLKDGRRRLEPCGAPQRYATSPSRVSEVGQTERTAPPLNNAPVDQQRVSRVPLLSQPLCVRCTGSSVLQVAWLLSRAKHLTKHLTWGFSAVEKTALAVRLGDLWLSLPS